MKTRIQIALAALAALFLAWALGLLLAPEASHALISRGPYDPVSARMLGAMFLAWALLAAMAMRDPRGDRLRPLAWGTLVVVAVALYLMLGSHGMPPRDTNVVSLVAAVAAAAFLIYAELTAGRGGGPARHPHRPAAGTVEAPRRGGRRGGRSAAPAPGPGAKKAKETKKKVKKKVKKKTAGGTPAATGRGKTAAKKGPKKKKKPA